jgi:hypothetical protein
MKTFRLFVTLLLLTSFGFPAKVGSLPKILNPSNIAVYENELYVVEGAEISIYSLKDLNLIRKFGREGEGPGELKIIPVFYNSVSVFHDYILVVGFDKVVFFSKEGKLIKEKKKSYEITKAVPIGENFVVNRNRTSADSKILYNCISLYNSEMEEIKEIYRQKHIQQGQPPDTKARLDMVMDLLYFKVYQDKIFIEESPNGFLIEVFDLHGNKLYQIKKEYEKIKVTDADKDEILERFKEDPLIKISSKQAGGWDGFKQIYIFNYADTFPAIQDLELSNEKLYVQTFKVDKAKNKLEYVIMDLKGKVIKKVSLPRFENTPIMSKVLGSKLHTIYNDKLYYVLENEKEEWELYMEEIK